MMIRTMMINRIIEAARSDVDAYKLKAKLLRSHPLLIIAEYNKIPQSFKQTSLA